MDVPGGSADSLADGLLSFGAQTVRCEILQLASVFAASTVPVLHNESA